MIFKDPFVRDVKEGRWFAWYPVNLHYSDKGKIAWLTHVEREWHSGGGWGYWTYTLPDPDED